MKNLNHGICRRGAVLARHNVANTGIIGLTVTTLTFIFTVANVFAQTSFFTGTTSSSWSASTNWSPVAPGSLEDLTIADSTPINSMVLDDGPHFIGALSFGNVGLRTEAFTVDATPAGSSLTISGGLIAAGDLPGSGNALTLRGGITIDGNQAWNVGGIIAGADKDQGLAITGPTTGSVAGAMVVNGTLTKTGAGMLTLTSVSLGNGSLAINSGALRLASGFGTTLTVGGTGTSGQITIADGASLYFYKGSSGDFGTLASSSISKAIILSGASNVEFAAAGAADVAIGSPIEFNGTHTLRLFSGNSASNITYRLLGNLSGAGTVSLASSGNGPRLLVFSGDNGAFAGQIVVGGRNVLRLASATAGSARAVYVLTGGNTAIESAGSSEMVLGGLSGTIGTVRNGGVTNTVLRVGGAGQTTTFAGSISNGSGGGTLAVLKEGPGDLILSGTANNYTGPTTVDEGSLVVSGAITASPVTINDGGILAGNGSVTTVTLDPGGAISPGNTTGHLESLGATSLTWNSGASPGMKLELGSVSNVSDQLQISGAFVKGAGTEFTFDFVGGGFEGATYSLVTFGSISGFAATDFRFTNLGAGLTGTFEIQSNTVTLTVIPEPHAAVACLAGLMLCGLRRRR